MTQRELEYIIKIAESGSISRAAEKLFVTQPSLSHYLQKVERELGTNLFRRTANGLIPTVAGECYLQAAHNMLAQYKHLENQLSWMNEMKIGRLSIGTTNFLGSIILPHILYIFNRRYPDIEISIVEGVSQKIENAILKGDVDIGLIHMPLGTEDICCKPLARESFLLAVPREDPLNEKSYKKEDKTDMAYIDLRLTADYNYILTYPSQRTRQRCNVILSKAGITPKIKYLTTSIQTATRMSGAGLGLTLVPKLYSKLSNQNSLPNVYAIEDEFDPFWELAVCYLKEDNLSRPAIELIKICMDIMPDMYTYMDQSPQKHPSLSAVPD